MKVLVTKLTALTFFLFYLQFALLRHVPIKQRGHEKGSEQVRA